MQARVEKTPTIQTSFYITQKTVTSLSSNPEDAQDKCSSSPNPISLVLVLQIVLFSFLNFVIDFDDNIV